MFPGPLVVVSVFTVLGSKHECDTKRRDKTTPEKGGPMTRRDFEEL